MLKPEVRQATILVADDRKAYRSLLNEWLRAQGYKVVCAVDGEDALNILRSQVIDVALLDVMMSRRTGFAVCRAIKSDPETRLIPGVIAGRSVSADPGRSQAGLVEWSSGG